MPVRALGRSADVQYTKQLNWERTWWTTWHSFYLVIALRLFAPLEVRDHKYTPPGSAPVSLKSIGAPHL